jgi:hypothetical protein
MFAVVFTSNNARFVKNHYAIQALKSWPNAIVNPDLNWVKGYPPHLWKLEDSKIMTMNLDERAARELDLKLNGADNVIRRIPELVEEQAAPAPSPASSPEAPKKSLKPLLIAGGLVVLSAIAYYLCS